MHFVVENVVFLDRAERSKSHMERHICRVNALVRKLSENIFGEVQSRSGSSSRAGFAAVYGVVTVLVLEFFSDIGRQRHLTYPVENVEEIPFEREAHKPVALVDDVEYLR